MAETSLKGLFQGMIPQGVTLSIGIVIGEKPVAIQLLNNPKMVASGRNLVLPRFQTKLKSGDKVWLLNLENGKQFLAIDAEVG